MSKEMPICKNCESNKVKKNGHTPAKQQRYFCKDCHTSFLIDNKSLSKNDDDAAAAAFEEWVDGSDTLGQVAKKNNIPIDSFKKLVTNRYNSELEQMWQKISDTKEAKRMMEIKIKSIKQQRREGQKNTELEKEIKENENLLNRIEQKLENLQFQLNEPERLHPGNRTFSSEELKEHGVTDEMYIILKDEMSKAEINFSGFKKFMRKK